MLEACRTLASSAANRPRRPLFDRFLAPWNKHAAANPSKNGLGGADLVTYWVEKARAQIEVGKLKVAGLVATNSIRGGANRKVLERIVASSRIFEAWSDEEWVNEGAAVRVSLVVFGFLPFPASGGGAGQELCRLAPVRAKPTTLYSSEAQ